jgi:hypothetical protein
MLAIGINGNDKVGLRISNSSFDGSSIASVELMVEISESSMGLVDL